MREVISRRFGPKHSAEWAAPDLLLIDGGQGQLAAALGVMDAMGITLPAVGLAKREEELVRRAPRPSEKYEMLVLDRDSHVLHLLQRVRDEAHRFAITYQSVLRGKRQTASLLDAVPGVGPATRRALVRRFGSVRGVRLASLDELAAAIGPAKAKVVKEHLGQATS
jgi:excinuclease ABC subunit C